MNTEYTVSTAADEPGSFLPPGDVKFFFQDNSPKISDQIFEDGSQKPNHSEVPTISIAKLIFV